MLETRKSRLAAVWYTLTFFGVASSYVLSRDELWPIVWRLIATVLILNVVVGATRYVHEWISNGS